MWFELIHRASSGVLLLMVLALVIIALRGLPVGHPARKTALGAGAIAIVEALLGAGLVLFGLVAENDSTARAVVIAVHLTNTLVLLALLSLTGWLARHSGVHIRSAGTLGIALALALIGLIAIGASGAVTALGDTLFPAASLREAVRHDLSPTAHLLVRMRVIHPVIAIIMGAFLIMLAGSVGRAVERARRAATFVSVLVIGQIVLGFVNLFLLAPIAMQVVHLLAADTLWIGVVVMAASTWMEPVALAAATPIETDIRAAKIRGEVAQAPRGEVRV
ncbi:MAG: heme A synthase [Chthonomonadales bacterium]|nr:heme A synthase [Chthonomonadales bacterium]